MIAAPRVGAKCRFPAMSGRAGRSVLLGRQSARSEVMYLSVGAYKYRVVIDGLETKVVFEDRTIYINEVTSEDRRLEELVHEAWHAWLFHVPRPQDEEQEAQLVALVLDSLNADLARQGGEAALRRLRKCA